MIGAARRYRELLTTLMMERALAGGSLPEEAESRHVDDLDTCWWAMTPAEQEDAERQIANDEPGGAPADLRIEDVSVEQGKHAPPRKAA